MQEAVRMPTPSEKERAKAWVEAHSCKGWRNGWCLVDGTLVPLFDRPYWFGESYFDRKCNYSLNIQVRFRLRRFSILIISAGCFAPESPDYRLRLRFHRQHARFDGLG
jgi:hypothetical protein